MPTCTSIFQVSCLTNNMEAAVDRLGGANFSAVTGSVHKGRGVPQRSDLDRADIDWIVSRADIAPGLRGVVASGFMSRIDVAPQDGRIDAREWANGRTQGLQKPAPVGVPTARRH